MLRAAVVAIGAACIVGAFFLANRMWFAGIDLGLFGALILLGTLFERRYRTHRAAGSAWESTAERFIDPTSGKLVEVRYNPQTGERAYIDAGER